MMRLVFSWIIYVTAWIAALTCLYASKGDASSRPLGFKTDYTEAYPEVWKKVNLFYAWFGIVCCCLTAGTLLFDSETVFLVAAISNIFVPLCVASLYSFIIGKRREEEENLLDERLRREAEERENGIRF